VGGFGRRKDDRPGLNGRFIREMTTFIVRCTLYVVRCTLYVVRCTLYVVFSSSCDALFASCLEISMKT